MNSQPKRNIILAILIAVVATWIVSCGSSDNNNSNTGGTLTITAPGIVGPNAPSPVGENPVTLTVSNATASDGSALTYTFQVATDESFATLFRQATGIAPGGNGQTSWAAAGRYPNGAYWWRARAVSGSNVGPFSAAGQFAVGTSAGQPPGEGETQIVFDSLTGGMTLGERFGGTFTAEGWRVNTNNDFLRFEVPSVSNGYAEWQNLGLTPRGANDASHMLFGMWDPSAGAFRQNPFRVHVQKLWSNPHNPPFMRFRWISQGREHEAGLNFTDWNPSQVYTFRVDWRPTGSANTARVFLDGLEFMTIGYNRPYNPNTHFIELGIGERGESVIDAVYRNFLVVSRN